MRRRVDDVQRQYAVIDPLKTRIETHRLYGERSLDLDAVSAELLQLSGEESILDVGCGPGRFLLHLRRGGHHGRLVGCDQSSAMIAEARASSQVEGFEIEGITGDAMNLPFDDRSFDWVVGRHMLYHVDDIPRALGEFSRVASCGILVSTNGRRNLPRICELLDDLLTEFGFTPVQMPSERFCIENAGEAFDAAGLIADASVFSNALVFTDVDPIVRYVMSGLPSFGLPDDETVAEMARWLRSTAQQRLDDLAGSWRDETKVGFFLVD